MNKRFLRSFFFILFLAAGLFTPSVEADMGVANLKRPVDTTIVPDKFLRRWDPVTLFFSRDTGPAGGGSEDRAEAYVKMSPLHPGAFTWLDTKTLQFRPSEPWPPLTRFKWRFQNRDTELVTLMSAPVKTLPANMSRDLDPVESLTLTFPEPVNPTVLARMLTVELRPLPGVDADQSRWLAADDFDIKILERSNRSDNASYVIIFHEPIPGSTHVTLHLRLSLEDKVDEAFQKISFSTAEPFQITHFGCNNQHYPVTTEGVSYSKEQAVQCSSRHRALQVRFSSNLAEVGPVEARNLVRFTPSVGDLSFKTAGDTLSIYGSFDADTLYQVSLTPSNVQDMKGRPLQTKGNSSGFFYFPSQSSFLRWETSQGVIERYGPQMVPLEGRGFERLDLRIYPIEPLNRSLWPFPDTPIVVNEAKRPPAPGEEARPFTQSNRYISSYELARHIKALGSPSLSELVPLPLRKGGRTAKFGLDLRPYLTRISGKAKPGTYLVGMRKLDSGNDRVWIRIQVTDLTLTTVEEAGNVKFVVTSLSSGTPVSDAEVRIEGSHNNKWVEIMSATTNANGQLNWKAAGRNYQRGYYSVRRIVVTKGDDILVLDPTRAPEKFANNIWSESRKTWLQWTQESLYDPAKSYKNICHIFSERPVYRPDEPVHIKGYIREHRMGELQTLTGKGTLVINGPGDLEWRYPEEITDMGSFYHKFEEESLPTGSYRAHFEYNKMRCGSVHFSKESYRLPKFEVNLNGPQTANLDETFEILMTAKYYAGGLVADRPIRWRVTQFPYTWAPKKLKGFIYSTDARFSNQGRFSATPAIHKEKKTDEEGADRIIIDPTIEATAQPRRYVVEATVVGADDQTVSNTHQVLALPPFVLGIKVPRYIERADKIEPEIVVVGPEGNLLQGHPVKVRLLQRQWHSHLRASDFSQGEAKYVTEVVDEEISQLNVTSKEKPLKLKLPIDGAGVYIVEIESRDKLGRTQVVKVDLFAGGDKPVTWSRPPTQVFTVTTDKKEYAPGEKANLILESPFQRARALVVIEEPDGNNIYQWVNITNGSGTFGLQIKKNYMPRLPVHFVLMRGRVKTAKPLSGSSLDLGKPATLAATKWVEVSPVKNRVDVDLAYPPKAQPGDEVDVTITLKDDKGNPLSGEATLWLVDQAVLALGKEQRLAILPDFIVNRNSLISLHDTRNLSLGYLPFQEDPGGGYDEFKESAALLDNVTIRKNFQPVPYYNPVIVIGKEGKVTLKVKLPDNLTNFKLRAKVISGPDRFGFAKGHLSVRLPVIVQPSLPRFVRPGDSFTATAIGRIVEGEGGPGKSAIRLDGLELKGEAGKTFEWVPNRAMRIDYELTVPTPEEKVEDKGRLKTVAITIGVERKADKAKDAFSVSLPIQPDRKAVSFLDMRELKPGSTLTLPAIKEPARPGTLKRSLLLANEPALVRMAAGLSYLMNYPHGCTEQRVSRARAHIASKRFMEMLYEESDETELEKAVNDTLEWIESVVDNNGLAAYWPGSTGYVSLTAWVVQFMVEARNAGFQIDEKLLDRLTTSLQQSLRSDYSYYIRGESYAERTWALTALASAGMLDSGYAAELARKSNYLNLESLAQVSYALSRSDSPETSTLRALTSKIWDGIVIRLYQGKEVYGGLQKQASARNALILPSETRTISEVMRAVSVMKGEEERKKLLLDALVTLGQGDGWGNTNTNAAALLALTEFISSPTGSAQQAVEIRMGQTSKRLSIGGRNSIQHLFSNFAGEIQISSAASKGTKPLVVRTVSSYMPSEEGSKVSSVANGFVVAREMQRIKEGDLPSEKIKLDKPGMRVDLSVGDIIEEHIEVVNPDNRHYVAIVVPMAAGMEPLNPALATAPPEAQTAGQLTMAPAYVAYLDDQMAYYYNSLPKGTYHFYFRSRATIPGRFIQPAAYAEMMYKQTVNGNSNGSEVVITPKEEGKAGG
ncbi:MAG: alpha-2-macroglobulin [Proteobacteria bacterium]|nr:alpha-2-macroglobulin [Pseudomonadota bacterium]